MGLRDDPGQQLIAVFVPTEDAGRLLAHANSQGSSRAELLRRMIKDFLRAAERGHDD